MVPSASIAVTPRRNVGTALLIHAGGWAGPDHGRQQALMTFPGRLFITRGWRTVSLDYARGKGGLQSVLDAVTAELALRSAGPLCLYGESSGGHLALLAAASVGGIDGVITLGAPTDFAAFRDGALVARNMVAYGLYEAIVKGTFGEPGPHTAEWEPAKVARSIDAAVLLLQQGDDQVNPPNQVTALLDAVPTARALVTAGGDFSDERIRYLHGTLNRQARKEMTRAISSFADRAVTSTLGSAARRKTRRSQPNVCPGVSGFAMPSSV